MKDGSSPPSNKARASHWLLSVVSCLLLLSHGTAFLIPSPNTCQRHAVRHVVATSFIQSSGDSSSNNNNNKQRLSRPERKAQERAKKQRRQKNDKRKKPKKIPQYKLHSQKISMLSKETSTADDVLQAIKRAQKYHDAGDLEVIENFLLKEVDENFAFGYLGSLLSRLAVAAMHMDNHELARKALQVRRVEYRSSMLPMESAAIIRGLLRLHNVTDALEVLDDELCLPLEVCRPCRCWSEANCCVLYVLQMC